MRRGRRPPSRRIMLQPPGTQTGSTVRSTRELGFLALAEIDYGPLLELPPHSHPDTYLSVVLRGRYTERVERTTRICEAGSLVLRPPEEMHASRFDAEESRCLMVRMSPEWLCRATHSRPLEHSVDLDPGEGIWLAARLHEEFLRDDPEAAIGIEGLVLTALAGLLRRRHPRQRRQAPPPWLGRVLDRIHASYRERLTIVALAEEEGVHPAHLARTFRRSQGATIAGTIRRLRVEHAREQLRTTRLPLAAIAIEAGFADQSHFTRSFRKSLGMTPKAYRDALGAR